MQPRERQRDRAIGTGALGEVNLQKNKWVFYRKLCFLFYISYIGGELSNSKPKEIVIGQRLVNSVSRCEYTNTTSFLYELRMRVLKA